MPAVPRLADRRLLAALLAAGAAALAAAAPGFATESCTTRACVSLSSAPETEVAPSGVAGTDTHISYTAVVRNNGSSSMTHTTLSQQLPPGFTFEKANAPAGVTCTGSGQSVSCQLGKLAGGSSPVTIAVTAKTATTETDQARSTVTVSFDERANDKPAPDPKQDTVSTFDDVKVTNTAGQTFVPKDSTTTIATERDANTSATNVQYATAKVTNAPNDVLASLLEAGQAVPGFNCILGQVTIQDQVYVCRGGGWIRASIPGTYTVDPLVFTLRWDSSVASVLQTKDNFVVFHTGDEPGAQPEALPGCPATPLCTRSVSRAPDGDWIAEVVGSHNGYYR